MNTDRKEIGKMAALALLSQIPGVSAFSKFFEDYVNSNWQERIELWKEETIKRLSQLDQEMEQKIRDTSNFASILATAQRGALEDIEEDKVGLYANTVINAIKNENIDNIKIHIFLNMLRDFSLLHIKILKSLNVKQNKNNSLGINETYEIWKRSIKEIYPELLTNEELFDIAYANLQSKKMLKNTYILYSNGVDKQTTHLADEFLQFIAEQENSNG